PARRHHGRGPCAPRLSAVRWRLHGLEPGMVPARGRLAWLLRNVDGDATTRAGTARLVVFRLATDRGRRGARARPLAMGLPTRVLAGAFPQLHGEGGARATCAPRLLRRLRRGAFGDPQGRPRSEGPRGVPDDPGHACARAVARRVRYEHPRPAA